VIRGITLSRRGAEEFVIEGIRKNLHYTIAAAYVTPSRSRRANIRGDAPAARHLHPRETSDIRADRQGWQRGTQTVPRRAGSLANRQMIDVVVCQLAEGEGQHASVPGMRQLNNRITGEPIRTFALPTDWQSAVRSASSEKSE